MTTALYIVIQVYLLTRKLGNLRNVHIETGPRHYSMEQETMTNRKSRKNCLKSHRQVTCRQPYTRAKIVLDSGFDVVACGLQLLDSAFLLSEFQILKKQDSRF